MNKLKMYLSSYIMQSGSYFDFNSNCHEQIFHVFILGLVLGLREHYEIRSNQESVLGRFDVIFIPKDKKLNAILLEFKIAKTPEELLSKSQEGLEKIKD
jgi:PD-(D/E)XK nuclease superfamily